MGLWYFGIGIPPNFLPPVSTLSPLHLIVLVSHVFFFFSVRHKYSYIPWFIRFMENIQAHKFLESVRDGFLHCTYTRNILRTWTRAFNVTSSPILGYPLVGRDGASTLETTKLHWENSWSAVLVLLQLQFEKCINGLYNTATFRYTTTGCLSWFFNQACFRSGRTIFFFRNMRAISHEPLCPCHSQSNPLRSWLVIFNLFSIFFPPDCVNSSFVGEIW